MLSFFTSPTSSSPPNSKIDFGLLKDEDNFCKTSLAEIFVSNSKFLFILKQLCNLKHISHERAHIPPTYQPLPTPPLKTPSVSCVASLLSSNTGASDEWGVVSTRLCERSRDCAHMSNQCGNIPPFVVVPREDFHEIAVNDFREAQIHDGGVGSADHIR